MDITEAFNITKPLSPEEQKSLDDEMLRIAIEMRDHNYSRSTHYIQDPEKPLCNACGGVINAKGKCPECGRDELGWK